MDLLTSEAESGNHYGELRMRYDWWNYRESLPCLLTFTSEVLVEPAIQQLMNYSR